MLFLQLRTLLAKSLLLSFGIVALNACAADAKPAASSTKDISEVKAVVLAKLKQARPDLNFQDVLATDVPELYEVTFNGTNSIYATASGDFFIVGDIYQVSATGVANLSEKKLNGKRAQAIASLNESDLISFNSTVADSTDIYVFTDVDCGYCRKLHAEVPELNKLGINVHYLAYPRAGIGSDSYKKMQAAWCAKDQQTAMNDLKAQRPIPIISCDSQAVAAQFNLGNDLGVNGTPAIVLKNGTLLPGYQPADRLAQVAKAH